MKKVVVVESPTKAKTISKFLGKGFIIKSSMGHIRDLPKKTLGVDINNNFKPKYIIIKGKEKTAKELKESIAKSEELFIATDQDREGEAIGWHIVELTNTPQDKIKRVVFHEITYPAIKEAFSNPRGIDMNLVEAQQARRILDRIVGYKLSPLLWKKISGKLSAGRVQSAALRILVDREKEIELFRTEPFFNLKIDVSFKRTKLEAFLVEFNGKNVEKEKIKDKKPLEDLKNRIMNKSVRVKTIDLKERYEVPPPPFVTSTLQQEGIRKFKFSSERVMSIAQRLYEGIDLPKGRTGLITYHRTDSVNISPVALKKVRNFIREEYGNGYLPKNPRIYKTKSKLAQEAHEAIRPTDPTLKPEKIKEYLTDEEYKIYSLVFFRFLACQMKSAFYKKYEVKTVFEDSVFKTEAQILVDRGFKVLFEEKKDKKQSKIFSVLGELKERDELRVENVEIKESKTKPPPRYTEASLIRKLEEEGIGRPSTYATIIGILKRRGYVRKSKNILFPQIVGVKVIELLKEYFSRIVDLKFTANMEEELDSIAKGEKKGIEVLNNFYKVFTEELENASNNIKKYVETDKKCPKCGSILFKKTEKFSEVLICRNCNYRVLLDENGNEIKQDEKFCPKCNSPMFLRRGKHGLFYACSGFPKCRHTENYKDK